MAKVGEPDKVRGDAVKAAGIAANPDRAGTILANRPDIVAAQTRWVPGIVMEMPKAVATCIEQIQPGIFATAPDAVVAIDEQGGHIVARQRRQVGGIVAIDAKTDAIVAGQPVGRADPQIAVAVLRQFPHGTRWHAVGDAEIVEEWNCGKSVRRHRTRRGNSQRSGNEHARPHVDFPRNLSPRR